MKFTLVLEDNPENPGKVKLNYAYDPPRSEFLPKTPAVAISEILLRTVRDIDRRSTMLQAAAAKEAEKTHKPNRQERRRLQRAKKRND